MFGKKDMKQEGAENSQNYQGQTTNVTNNYGLTYKDAKDIALDVFNNNFIKLKDEAAVIAVQRAEQVTEQFLIKLQEKAPEAIENFKEPALQESLFNVQKEYAKNPDEELGELLTNILVDRAKIEERNILQIVLDDALKIAPKLTKEQMNILTFIFIINETVKSQMNFEQFKLHIENIYSYLPSTNSLIVNLRQIEFLGCAFNRGIIREKIEAKFLRNYQMFFQKGFTKELFFEKAGELGNIFHYYMHSGVIVPHEKDINKFRFNFYSINDFKKKYGQIDSEILEIFEKIYSNSIMSELEAIAFLKDFSNKFEDISAIYNDTIVGSYNISNIGIAIGLENWKISLQENVSLSVWLK